MRRLDRVLAESIDSSGASRCGELLLQSRHDRSVGPETAAAAEDLRDLAASGHPLRRLHLAALRHVPESLHGRRVKARLRDAELAPRALRDEVLRLLAEDPEAHDALRAPRFLETRCATKLAAFRGASGAVVTERGTT
ncbi:MAG TPA: hypothetical protein VF841_16790, partial [Anaeromyxobacter sp.]